jgi:very-short-patch-repair endonuclease
MDYSQALIIHCRVVGLPEPTPEYRFHPKRKWRFDLAYQAQKIAIEIEGGIWTGGRHTRPAGYEKDCEKYNTATLLGWRVLRFTPAMVTDGRAIKTIEQLLEAYETI